MIDLLTTSANLLRDAQFSVERVAIAGRTALAFEDRTVLGFLFAYEDPQEGLERWARDAEAAVRQHQFALRRAGQKAWNTYILVLCSALPDHRSSIALSAIEEDLTGTRKIARAGIADVADLRSALLPLLPLQNAPVLDPVDVSAEIRQRATDVAPAALDAFLSSAEDAVVIQVFEEQP
jgi:hypothetical protein